MKGNRDGWWLAAVVSPLLLLGCWMIWPDSREPAPAWPAGGDAGAQPRKTLTSQWQAPSSGPMPVAGDSADAAELQRDGPFLAGAGINLDRLQHALANIGVDENGNLILDEIALVSLRQAFEGFQDSGQVDLERVQLYVQAGLAGETGPQAARILGDYVSYRQALEQAEADWTAEGPLSPREKLARTIALRRQHMDPLTSSQLFAGEDAHQRYLIAREEVRTDPTLASEERQAALSRLKEDLRSGALLVNSQGTNALEDLRNDRKTWKQLGLSDTARDQLEQQTLGLVAARDLAGSDREDWQRRYNRFDRERDTILRAGLSNEEKQRQIDALLDTHFTSDELDAAKNWLPRHLRADTR